MNKISDFYPNEVRCKRVFFIGAGMSKECGGPLIKDFFNPTFLNSVNKNDVKTVMKFKSAIYPKSSEPTIEELLSFVDYLLEQRETIGVESRKYFLYQKLSRKQAQR